MTSHTVKNIVNKKESSKNESCNNFLNKKHIKLNSHIKQSYTLERQGRWNENEHFLFLKGCLLYANNWQKIKEILKSRSSAQIRSHAQKYINKLEKKYITHPIYNNIYFNHNILLGCFEGKLYFKLY